MYVRLDENNFVTEIIPDIDPVFPDVPVSERYTADFVAALIYVDDSVEIACGMVYDKEAETFAFPEPVARPPAEDTTEEDITDTGTLTQAEINFDFDYRLCCLELGIN